MLKKSKNGSKLGDEKSISFTPFPSCTHFEKINDKFLGRHRKKIMLVLLKIGVLVERVLCLNKHSTLCLGVLSMSAHTDLIPVQVCLAAGFCVPTVPLCDVPALT